MEDELGVETETETKMEKSAEKAVNVHLAASSAAAAVRTTVIGTFFLCGDGHLIAMGKDPQRTYSSESVQMVGYLSTS